MLLAEFYGSEGWRVNHLRTWLPDHLVQQVQEVTLHPEQRDCMIWACSPSGEFATASAWDLIRQRRGPSLVDDLHWSKVVPLKMSFFAWKVLRSLVPVDINLKHRGILLASRCSCCLSHEETLGHLFATGPVAAAVWEFFQRRFGILEAQPSSLAARVLLWFSSASPSSRGHIRTIVPVLILWFLWKTRNRACFEAGGVVAMIEDFVEQLGVAKMLSRCHFRGDYEDKWARLGTLETRRSEVVVVSWKRPPRFSVKLNTDASVVLDQAYGGGLLWDSDGCVIFAFHKELGKLDVLEAEGLALLHGLRYCEGVVSDPLLVEVDSESLVRMLHSNGVAKWPLCNTLRRIRSLLDTLSASLSHVVREANSAADKLAGLRSELYCTAYSQLPRSVRTAVLLDSREFPFPRCRSVGG
nr:uncharacterized protein LOC113708150 [Coffea arabica]